MKIKETLKRHGPVIWIVFLLCVVTAAFADEEYEMHKAMGHCYDEANMVAGIQAGRIKSGNTLEGFVEHIEKNYNPGGPLGNHTTPELIARKDKFYEQTIEYARIIYAEVDEDVEPEVLYQQVLNMCVAGKTFRKPKKPVKKYSL